MLALLLNPNLLPLAASADPTSIAVNYGFAGLVVALFVLGRVHSNSEVDGLTKRLAEAHQEAREAREANAALVAQITSGTLPQLAHLADVVERLPQTAETDLAKRLDELSRSIETIERRTR